MAAVSLGEIVACAASADGGCEAAGASVVVPERLGGLVAHCPKHPLLVGKAVDELYRRWSITVMREIPFAVIQFPLWEAMKKQRGERKIKSGSAPVNAASSNV